MSTGTIRFACAVVLLTVCAAPQSAAVTQGASGRPDAIATERLPTLSVGSAEQQRYLDDRDLDTSGPAKIKLMYPDIGAVLGLTPQRERELLKLLSQYVLQTDGRTRQDLQVVGVTDSHVDYGEPPEAAITRQNAAVKLLLGTDSFWRYHAYMRTLAQRNQLRTLTSLLAFDPLTHEQIEDMVQLLADHAEDLSYLTFREVPHPRLHQIPDQQRLFEYRRALQQQLLQRSAQILDGTQLAVFSRLQTEQLDAQRRRLGMPASAGSQRGTKSASGELKGVPLNWRLELSINEGAPQTMTFQGISGRSEAFTTPEGLLVEAIPLLGEDHAFRVRLKVFETDGMGRHFIGSMYGSGEWQPANTNFAYAQHTVLAGSRGYALALAIAGIR